jgi:hypothetical protein
MSTEDTALDTDNVALIEAHQKSRAEDVLARIGERIGQLKRYNFIQDRIALNKAETKVRRAKNKLARTARRINRITTKPQTGNRSRGR